MDFKHILVRIYLRVRDTVLFTLLTIFLPPPYSDRRYSPVKLAYCAFWQKIVGINRRVPWPVHWTSQVASPEKINPGTRLPGISMGCYLDGRNGIEIGKNVWIGPKVSLISRNHDVHNYHSYVEDSPPIVIGDNCWLGAGSIILPGVQLRDHVIVAAGTVVTKSFDEEDIILAGVPARIIKKLDTYQG